VPGDAYKIPPTNVLWSPKDGSAMQLWKENGTKQPKLSVGVPNPIPFHLIWGNGELKANEKERFISSRLSRYIKFWKLGMSKDDLYFRVMGPYVKYWENILEMLSTPIPH
jgi:hypothetical protein